MRNMTDQDSGISDSLQHPRRSLGNRYRSQAEKFLAISSKDSDNLSWAVQNAKQSVLYDFTNHENWKILVKILVEMKDSEGVRATIEDLFSVLGRDPDHLSQLAEIDIIESSELLLEGALRVDPLDPDEWWAIIDDDKGSLIEFSERVKRLDVSDHRANILFSRRLERIRENGKEDIFIELSRYLLSQRPNNHEAWNELGRMYERREEFDQSWFCYDQAETHFPPCKSRALFRERMRDKVREREMKPWKRPSIGERIDFLEKMRSMSSRQQPITEMPMNEEEEKMDSYALIERLRNEGKLSEAFFIARRMAAEGEDDSTQLVREILEELDEK